MKVLKALLVGGTGGENYHTLYSKIEKFEEEKKDIKVKIVDKLFYPDIYSRLEKDIKEGKDDYDVLSAHTSFVGSHSKYYLPLKDYFTNSELKDFIPKLIEASKFEGELVEIPRHVDVRILFYRKDLFENEKEKFKTIYGYDLKPPEDWNQLKDIAEFFTRPPDLYGFAFVGKRHPLVGTFMEMLAMWGGRLIDDKGNPAFNSKEGEEALQFMVDLYRKWKVTPPETPDFMYEDVSKAFREGKVAMVFDWPGVLGSLREKSKVIGKYSFAPYPKGPSGKRYVYGGAHAFAVYKKSRYVEEAVSLIKFLTSQESQYFEYIKEGFLPTRISVWDKIQEEAKKDELEYLRLGILRKTIEENYLPVKVKDWVNFYENLWPELNKALKGEKKVKEALNDAYKKIISL